MDKASEIKATIFDWAGVFCSPGEPFAHPAFLEQTGLSVDELGERVGKLQKEYYRGRVSSEEFWQRVIEQFDLQNVTIEALNAAYLDSYALYPGMLEFADSLRPRYKTALLSNLTHEMMEKIASDHAVAQYFDQLFFSNEIGHLKPEPESFRAALDFLQTKPEETLFIDDSRGNIDAAAKLGMQVFHFQSPNESKPELEKTLNL